MTTRSKTKLSIFVFLLAPGILFGQQAVVILGTNLRADPSTKNPPVQSLAKGTHIDLIEKTATNGFYHVRVSGKKEGWVWGKNLSTSGQVSTANRMLVRRPVSLEAEREPLSATKACQPDLNSCPVSGCAIPDDPHGLVNQLKRRVPSSDTASLLTLEDFQALQDQADALVGEDKELTAEDRAKLTGLKVSSGKVSEGDVVSLVGYLVGVPHPNTGESVNCNLRGEQNNDFHIPVSNDPDNTDFQGVVVEMIPQNRPDTWTIANLTQVENSRQLVMVTGALLYDNLHVVNGDSSSPKSGQPHRFSLWEAHPLIKFMVCVKADNSCDPSTAGDWAPLGASM